MTTLEIGGNVNYSNIIQAIRNDGLQVPSRYGMTKEMGAFRVFVPIGLIVNRAKMNAGIGWQEGLQLLAQIYRPEWIKRVAPKANMDLFTMSMAYGPRIMGQVPDLLNALQSYPETRQAILYIGKPEDGPTSNQPCTTTIQYLIRNGSLRTFVSMRSWDLIKGFPYDLMMFSLLSQAIARCLGISAEGLFVNAASAHVYDSDADIECRDLVTYFSMSNFIPTNWVGIKDWAYEEASKLEQHETPRGIIISGMRIA